MEYVKVRPVVSFPTLSERKILCQGIINPTVFNLSNRCDGIAHSQNSWFFRPYPFQDDGSGGTVAWEGNDKYKTERTVDGRVRFAENGATVQFMHNYPLFSNDDIGCEIQGMYFNKETDGHGTPTFLDVIMESMESIERHSLLARAETYYVTSRIKSYLKDKRTVPGTTARRLDTDDLQQIENSFASGTTYYLTETGDYIDGTGNYAAYKYNVMFNCDYSA